MAGTIILCALGAVGLVAWLVSMYATYRLFSNLTRSPSLGQGVQVTPDAQLRSPCRADAVSQEFKSEMTHLLFSQQPNQPNGWAGPDYEKPSQASSTIHAL